MEFIYSFLFAGIVCLIGQIILDNTKLLPGHITSLFVVIGAALDTFSIYDLFVDTLAPEPDDNKPNCKYAYDL